MCQVEKSFREDELKKQSKQTNAVEVSTSMEFCDCYRQTC